MARYTAETTRNFARGNPRGKYAEISRAKCAQTAVKTRQERRKGDLFFMTVCFMTFSCHLA